MIDAPQFAVMQAPSPELESFLTIGSYDKLSGESYQSQTSLIAHRISGSFHWQLKLNKFSYGEDASFAPSYRTAFMDTGSTRILMPKQDWLDFFAMVCSELPEHASCYTSDNYRVLRGDITDRELFKPVRIQIDNVIYFLPLE